MTDTIIAIIGSLGGLTGLVSLLFIKQERRSKDLDNENKDLEIEARQSEEWRKLYEQERDALKEREAKIDALYEEIKMHRNEKAQMAVKIAELEVRCTKAELLMCKRPGCAQRQPQTGY